VLPLVAVRDVTAAGAFSFKFCESVSSELHEASDTTAAASAHTIFAMFFLVILVFSFYRFLFLLLNNRVQNESAAAVLSTNSVSQWYASA
jgi:hypothetical protein